MEKSLILSAKFDYLVAHQNCFTFVYGTWLWNLLIAVWVVKKISDLLHVVNECYTYEKKSLL